jgi:DNA-binding SARP family transcriptional activator
MSGLTISLLGRLDVHGAAGPLPGFEPTKVQELFCYLLLFREKPHAREALAEVLWSNSGQARKYLRKALWQLQTALDADSTGPGTSLLEAGPEWIQLNPSADIRLDVALLEHAFLQVRNVPGTEVDAATAVTLAEAAALYHGDLLEGCYADWCLLERERCRHMYLALLDKLMAFCEVQGRYEEGVGYGHVALRHDGARERTHRFLMRLYYLNGERTEAVRQYQRCLEALERELGVTPTARTRQLFAHICADETGKGILPEENGSGSPSFSHLCTQIEQAQAILTQVHNLLLRRDTLP